MPVIQIMCRIRAVNDETGRAGIKAFMDNMRMIGEPVLGGLANPGG